jgi:hypothetical protein
MHIDPVSELYIDDCILWLHTYFRDTAIWYDPQYKTRFTDHVWVKNKYI